MYSSVGLRACAGILLRRLISDRQLSDVSHIVIDEVHERSLESDLLMLLLRDVLQENKQLKLVLMSATAESGLFASYFEKVAGGKKGTASGGSVSVVDIPGFTYPVRELSLEDAVQRLRDEGGCCQLCVLSAMLCMLLELQQELEPVCIFSQEE